MERLITITKERLKKASTPKGGYNAKQFKRLGFDYPPKKGWKNEIIGKKIELWRFLQFVIASNNQEYIKEIESLLPSILPDVDTEQNLVAIVAYYKNKGNVGNKQATSKAPTKKERLALKKQRKRELQRSERINRILSFGVHKAANLILNHHAKRISPSTERALNGLLQKEDSSVSYIEAHKVYTLLKRHGIVLACNPNGTITERSFTPSAKLSKEQLLYVIRIKDSDYCKIGISSSPKDRMKELQTSNPQPLMLAMVFETIESAMKLERKIHKTFSARRQKGEWFKGVSDEEIISAIDKLGVLKKKKGLV